MSEDSSKPAVVVAPALKPEPAKASWGWTGGGVFLWLLSFLAPQEFVGLILPTLLPLLPSVANVRVLIIYILIELLTVGLTALFAKRLMHLTRQDLGIVKFKAGHILKAIIGFMVYFGASIALISVATVLFNIDTNGKQDLGFNSPQSLELILVGLLLAVIVPITEEFLFRGFLFGILRKRFSFTATAITVSLLFGAAHIHWDQPASLIALGIDTFALSYVQCYMRETTGSLWVPIIMHSLKNTIAFAYLFIYNVH